MTQTVTATDLSRPFFAPRQVLRFVTLFLLVSCLTACVVTPTEPTVTEPGQVDTANNSMATAVDMYNSDNYSGAMKEFANVISSAGSSANDRRLAHLGNAMVYLSNDEQWHSLENAKMSLVDAGQVVPGANEEFNIETDLLFDAITAVIGTESKYVVLKSKSGNSGAEVVQLKKERDQLAAERDELLAEQKSLNEALEKLKQLTLGN